VAIIIQAASPELYTLDPSKSATRGTKMPNIEKMASNIKGMGLLFFHARKFWYVLN